MVECACNPSLPPTPNGVPPNAEMAQRLDHHADLGVHWPDCEWSRKGLPSPASPFRPLAFGAIARARLEESATSPWPGRQTTPQQALSLVARRVRRSFSDGRVILMSNKTSTGRVSLRVLISN